VAGDLLVVEGQRVPGSRGGPLVERIDQEGVVELEDGGRLAFRESSRRDQTLAVAREELVAYVETHPACKTGDATAAIENGNAAVRQKAVSTAKERSLIVERPKGSAKLLYPSGWEFQDELDV
jgi:hypothetical protein